MDATEVEAAMADNIANNVHGLSENYGLHEDIYKENVEQAEKALKITEGDIPHSDETDHIDSNVSVEPLKDCVKENTQLLNNQSASIEEVNAATCEDNFNENITLTQNEESVTSASDTSNGVFQTEITSDVTQTQEDNAKVEQRAVENDVISIHIIKETETCNAGNEISESIEGSNTGAESCNGNAVIITDIADMSATDIVNENPESVRDESETLTEITVTENKQEVNEAKDEPKTEAVVEEYSSDVCDENPKTLSNEETITTETVTIEEISSDAIISDVEQADPVVVLSEEQVQEMSIGQNDSEAEIIVLENVEDVIVETVEEHASEETSSVVEVQEEELHKPSEEEKKRNREILSQAVKTLKIPHHVLGRNIENPVDDLFSNGRVPPKPRLGVKIPYRNLTSQIVSKQEIENVIIERARQKSNLEPPAKGDVFFTRKLTQRLAKKIVPSEKKDEPPVQPSTSNDSSIKDNSDLLAILEGDDDVDDPKEAIPIVPEKIDAKSIKPGEPIDKEREREIALKQLEQLPQRRRGRSALHVEPKKTYIPAKKTEVSSKTQETPTMKEDQKKAEVGHKVEPKQKTDIKYQKVESKSEKVSPKQQKSEQKSDDRESSFENETVTIESKDDMDIEPRFVTSGVVKTYTRKRKPSEPVAVLVKNEALENSPKKALKASNEQKVSIDLPPNTYVTKSSRVIKKKIIWDPDESPLPFRSHKTPKVEQSFKDKAAAAAKEKVTPPVKEKVVPVTKEKPSVAKEKTVTPQKTVEKKIQKLKTPEEKQKKLDNVQSLKKPKRLTEVDRLLMDEGAVNMLYEVKNAEDQHDGPKQKKRKLSTISLDKAEIELLNKTNEIKNDLQNSSTKESPKSLRKKEAFAGPPKLKREILPGTITRKKSRDSNRSSVHSPPASPGMFPHHAEASRIIRRHSSSSFSSDNDTAEKEDKINLKSSKKKVPTNLKVQKSKKAKVSVDKVELTAEERDKLNEEMSKSFNKLVAEENGVDDENKPTYENYKMLRVQENGKFIQIVLNHTKKDSPLNIQVSVLFVTLTVI